MRQITADRFDRDFPPKLAKTEKLWGAPAIAAALGVSIPTVYRLAGKADCPIYRPDGRYFALRHELDLWLRTKIVLDP